MKKEKEEEIQYFILPSEVLPGEPVYLDEESGGRYIVSGGVKIMIRESRDAGTRRTNEQGGMKDDKYKAPMWLVPLECMEQAAIVMKHGADKYGRDNWKLVDAEDYYSAALRHMNAIQQGEELDKDSGLPHISHLLCNVVFLTFKYLHTKGDKTNGQ